MFKEMLSKVQTEPLYLKKQQKWKVSRTAFGIQAGRIDAADGYCLLIHKRSKTCHCFPPGCTLPRY